MLVLSRRPGESIAIGPHIKFSILQVKWKQVRLGVEAPENTRIRRQEIYVTAPTPQPCEGPSIHTVS